MPHPGKTKRVGSSSRSGSRSKKMEGRQPMGPGGVMRGQLPENVLLKNPAGTYSFVGRVHPKLALVTLEGKEPSEEQINRARQFGPRLAGVKTRTFPTKAAAMKAAKELGVEVQES